VRGGLESFRYGNFTGRRRSRLTYLIRVKQVIMPVILWMIPLELYMTVLRMLEIKTGLFRDTGLVVIRIHKR